MANKNFVVKNGLTVGSFTVDANSGNIATPGALSVTSIRTDNFLNSNGAPISVTGYTGSAGADGTIGVDGYTGSQGTVGYVGSKGNTGSIGYTGSQGGSSFSSGTTPPESPALGDFWFNTTRSTILQFANTGTDSYWIEITNPAYNFGTSSLTENVIYQSTLMYAEYLIVAGGGGGGNDSGNNSRASGGGGAGGLITGTAELITGIYTITVGAGGATAQHGVSGTGSEFYNFTTVGGGGGGYYNVAGYSGGSGGGGGGSGSEYSGSPGSGTTGQGNRGGSGNSSGPGGGGGGGAGGVGLNAPSYSNGGSGGPGLQSSITGTATYYAGGGGGGTVGNYITSIGYGGIGGGGDGSASGYHIYGPAATAGAANTGGGGGGGANYTSLVAGQPGGSGVVILRTLETAKSTTGSPTLTTDGNYNIYKFTSSGTIEF